MSVIDDWTEELSAREVTAQLPVQSGEVNWFSAKLVT